MLCSPVLFRFGYVEKFVNEKHDDVRDEEENGAENDDDDASIDTRGIIREILQILIKTHPSEDGCLESVCEFALGRRRGECPATRCPSEEAFLDFATRTKGHPDYGRKIQLELETLEETLFEAGVDEVRSCK